MYLTGVGPETRVALMPWHRFFGAATFVLGVATCCMGLAEKQGFTKCAPDPTYKFCPQLQLAGDGGSNVSDTHEHTHTHRSQEKII